jgi:hypothetical protein
MVYHLMRNPSIILQDIVILQSLRNGDLLRDGEHLGQLVVGDVVQLCAVVFGDHELCVQTMSASCNCSALFCA